MNKTKAFLDGYLNKQAISEYHYNSPRDEYLGDKDSSGLSPKDKLNPQHGKNLDPEYKKATLEAFRKGKAIPSLLEFLKSKKKF